MTASLPAPPALSREAFTGKLVPPEIQARVLSLLVDSSPFAASLTRMNISAGSVLFPVAAPSGQAWVSELTQIPLINLNDDAVVVAVAKIAGLLDISNEMLSDSAINIITSVQQLLSDSMGPDLDHGLLEGSGPPEPVGVLDSAPTVGGADLLAAVAAAIGDIGDSGGTPNTIALSGAALANANTDRASDGQLIYPGGFGTAVGLNPVVVPGLPHVLVYDSTRMFTVVNGGLSQVDISDSFRFDYDAVTLRIKARVACACPVPAKTIRRLTIGIAAPAKKAPAK